ncbi:hypothetical protein [Nocardioides humi]|uniref:Uncharacterized protein n=1 Tax=Nocardioides humi TaxID=449461 RepID=A0ABN2B5T8_9ACTN|nr:hypothetical protein [Nocardioides humi]
MTSHYRQLPTGFASMNRAIELATGDTAPDRRRLVEVARRRVRVAGVADAVRLLLSLKAAVEFPTRSPAFRPDTVLYMALDPELRDALAALTRSTDAVLAAQPGRPVDP